MLRIGVILESFQSLKDKTLKVVFTTQEPTPEQLTEISKSIQSFGYLAFKKEVFQQKEIDDLESLKSEYDDQGKSPSQRLRAVLYKNWEISKEGYDVFPDYYRAKMEKLINHFKSRLD